LLNKTCFCCNRKIKHFLDERTENNHSGNNLFIHTLSQNNTQTAEIRKKHEK